MARFNRLEVLLSTWSLVLLITLGMIPIAWTIGREYEGRLFPVVVPATYDNETPDDTSDDYPLPIVVVEYPSRPDAPTPYVDIYVQFEKVRNCEFLIEEVVIGDRLVRLNRSLSWYDINNQRLRIEFPENDDHLPASRPVGEQYAGPWRIYGVNSVAGTTATVAHRCHPLWLTYTHFHP